MNGSVWQVVVVALALALVFPAVNIGFENSAVEKSANQSATVDYDNPTEINQSDVFRYGESITITSGGTTLDGGTDYEWYSGNGTVKWINTSATSDGDSAEIAYNYSIQTNATETSRRTQERVAPAVGLLLLIVSVGTLWSWIGGGGL